MVGEIVEERLVSLLPRLRGLGAVVKFDLGPAGAPVVDARAVVAELATDPDMAPDCTIRITEDNLLKLLDGELDPMIGYALGKIKVVGSLGIAMKLIGAIG